jgi:hypothetical protein
VLSSFAAHFFGTIDVLFFYVTFMTIFTTMIFVSNWTVRCLVAEKMIEELEFPCKFAEEGCDVTLSGRELERHEERKVQRSKGLCFKKL